jgi:hypothetical protein
MTKSGLRREIERGNLTASKMAGKHYTSLNAIREMEAKCRVDPRVPASTSDNAVVAKPFGSSSMEKMKSAQAAAQMTAETLKRSSPNISPESIVPTGKTIIRLKSLSQTS